MKNEIQLSELRAALLDYKHVWRMAIFISLLVGLFGFTSMLYMMEVYDRVINSRNLMTLLMVTLLALAAYAVMEIFEKIRARMLWGVGVQLELRLSDRIYKAMFDGMLKRQMRGAAGVQADFRTVREFFNNPALGAMFELPMALVATALLFYMHPIMGGAGVLGAFIQTFVAWLIPLTSRKPLMEAQRKAQEAQSYAEASLRNAEVMESMGMLPTVMKNWQRHQDAFLVYQAQASEVAGGLSAMSKLMQILMGSVMLGLSTWLIMEQVIQGSSAVMIVGGVLAGRILAPMLQIVQQWSAVLGFAVSWKRLEHYLEEVPARERNMNLPAPKGELIVEGVSVAPPGSNQLVLRGLQFGLPPGCVLGVVGPSASGKTSLARVLMGLWWPSSGKVRLDGADVHLWDRTELGPHVGYMPQGVELIEGTLAENIARFGEIDMTRIESAARLVGLHDFIVSLPQGYDTPVGRDGAMLSGGQRQRVALSRALYGNPVMVVLDEPNSSLDEAGEAALCQAIEVMKSSGTTFVLITHRTSVLSVTDRMLLLRDGAQVMYGPTAEVLQKLQAPAVTPPMADAPAVTADREA